MAYNTSFTRRKSGLLHDLDCRTTGAVRVTGAAWEPQKYAAVVVTDEAVEVGECISMVRVPRGFTVTGAQLFFTANADATIGLGDPFCCGRLPGPISTTTASGAYFQHTDRFSCATYVLQKVGRSGDGCGFGYTYTCETDLVVTNGYGSASFNQGGSSNPSTASGGSTSAVLASGTVIGVVVEGYLNPAFTNIT